MKLLTVTLLDVTGKLKLCTINYQANGTITKAGYGPVNGGRAFGGQTAHTLSPLELCFLTSHVLIKFNSIIPEGNRGEKRLNNSITCLVRGKNFFGGPQNVLYAGSSDRR